MRLAGLREDLASLRRRILEAGQATPGRLPPLALSLELEAEALISRTVSVALHEDSYVRDWIEERRRSCSLRTEIVPLESASGWHIDGPTGSLAHESGRFFSVTGLRARHRFGFDELEWDQPIIEQPEIGLLGIAVKRIDGLLHFCLQAKEEPGNIDGIQLSPTLQATYSNYTRVHGGKAPPFLDLFLEPPEGKLLFGRLQTEDGGRFLYKSNRNLVVAMDDDGPVDLPEGFIWLTLRQIADLMRKDNAVNACARSVLSSFVLAAAGWHAPAAALSRALGSGSDWRSLLDQPAVEHILEWASPPAGSPGIAETIQWIDNRRSLNHIVCRRESLLALKEWHLDRKGFFSHREGRFFRIVGLRVFSDTRETTSWCQPIIENPMSGIIGLLVRRGPGGPEILMQSKAELGNRNTVQLGPSVQFTPGNYHGSGKIKKPFLFEEFSGHGPFTVLKESCQSEEGARFFREEHLHRILLLPDDASLDVPPQYRWLPLEHVRFLLNLGEQVNSCARSVISCLL